MKLSNFSDIIIKPIVTEKTLVAQTKGKYTFFVSLSANKDQIIHAFTQIFGVKPVKINIVKIKGKQKTDWKKHLPIQKPDRKKAIISLPKDKKIDILTIKTK